MKTVAASSFFAALAFSACAHAGWSITGDVERFRWVESQPGSPNVTETGPIFGIGARFAQDLPAGWQFGWRGRLYFGSVDYNGSLLETGAPVNGTTEYKGIINEGQAVYRLPGNPYGLELVSGLILDYWNRQLSSFQSEQFWIGSLRLGVNADRRAPDSWFGGAGVKYPFYAHQNAHFPDIGYDPNPALKPKGQISLYAEAGYRFRNQWSLTGYYDSYRFKESDPVTVRVNFAGSAFGPPGTPVDFVQPATRVDSFGVRLQYSFQ